MHRLIGLFFVTAVLFSGTLLSTPLSSAESLQEKIDRLNAENARKDNANDELEGDAASLSDKISKLQERINGLQGQINDNQDKIAALAKKIKKTEAELVRQKNLLGENIRVMYLEGDISTLEMLASSQDLSEFVDKQQYRNSVKSKIVSTLDKITDLKHELKDRQDEVQSRLKEQQTMQAELAGRRSETNRLLGLNHSQQSQLDKQIRANNSRIVELKRQQAIENMRLFGGGEGVIGGGGYPWGNAKCLGTGKVDGWCPGYEWGYNGSYLNWNTGGYAYRNCTDWVSYRVRSTGKHAPGGLGNANSWDDRAPSYGFKVSSKPKVGAAAVSNSGYYGHVMYVESVNADGTIVVSDYNRGGTGKYAISTINPSGLRFIYF